MGPPDLGQRSRQPGRRPHARDRRRQRDQKALPSRELPYDAGAPQVDCHHPSPRGGDRLAPHRQEDSGTRQQGRRRTLAASGGAQGCLHLADSRRAVHVRERCRSREEPRKPVQDRSARTDDENHSTRQAHGLEPHNEGGPAHITDGHAIPTRAAALALTSQRRAITPAPATSVDVGLTRMAVR